MNWNKPKELDDAMLAFPANVTGTLLPPIDEIPEKFKNYNHPMSKVQSQWFYKGLPKGTVFHPRKGVDRSLALRQLRACQGSFEPKHEHKAAGVAYLLHLFFEKIDIPQVG